MKRYGLIGHPLTHSYSKAYFTEKFEREGLDCEYLNFDLPSLQGREFQEMRKHPNLKGFNVTSPYKQAIIPLLDEIDPLAEEIGAVNTVKVLANSRLKGYNTDILGLMECGLRNGKVLNEADSEGSPEAIIPSALILGTGGASKAVQYALRKRNIPYQVVSRTHDKGDLTYESLTRKTIQSHLLIINATPLGMAPNLNESPDIPYEVLSPQHTLFDLIYNPVETLFLHKGRERGATTINGLAMLHAQADASWEIWNRNEQ